MSCGARREDSGEPYGRRADAVGDALAAAGTAPSVTEPPRLREQARQQMLASIGGWSGTVVASIPTVVFVIVNATSGLRWAITAAVAAAVVLAGYRLIRHQSVQQALGGLLGVAVAALIAARTGEARGYFLFGILTSFLYGTAFVASILVRRPLVGLAWEFLDPTPVPAGDAEPWYRRPALMRGYVLATLGAAGVFLARAVVQWALYEHDATGWLAVARIAMGYPLFIAAVVFGFWAIRRARHQVTPLEPS
jgi:Protein of unknown function (DUF3159)